MPRYSGLPERRRSSIGLDEEHRSRYQSVIQVYHRQRAIRPITGIWTYGEQPRSQLIHKWAVSVPPQHQQAPIPACGLLRTTLLHLSHPEASSFGPGGGSRAIACASPDATAPSRFCAFHQLLVRLLDGLDWGKQACIHAWAIYHVVEASGAVGRRSSSGCVPGRPKGRGAKLNTARHDPPAVAGVP
ncbi:hypothetical protein GSI_01139 [Ganoderma sinense ZZ0214-1]|uniref:Uncharacterized protein n=1 Tax=Ganoderma sinense ZZ0214-1 TaxID=1077348 RepID=A0A2G8SUJ4_9APHY|nr:hypothetical protein GSI_01139 [Ganoderma sinense ZZ0214-1]